MDRGGSQHEPDPLTNTLALLLRGCDVGISQLDIYNALTGKLRNLLAVDGCGRAVALPAQNKAVTSWQARTPPFNPADATIFDFGIAGPTGNDVAAHGERSSAALWLPNPATCVGYACRRDDRGCGTWQPAKRGRLSRRPGQP